MKVESKIFYGNIYIVFLLRILLLFFIYSLLRLSFFAVNYSLLSNIDSKEFFAIMKGGLRFDASAIVYTNIIVILLHIIPFRFRYNAQYQVFVKCVFYVVNALAIIIDMADAAYYPFTLRRSTILVLSEFQHENLFNFIRFIWQYWQVTAISILLIMLMIFLYRKIKVNKSIRLFHPAVYYPVNALLMVIVVALSIAAARGGFTSTTRPITLSNAAEYISRSEHRAMVLNTPFALVRSTEGVKLDYKNYYTDNELEQKFPVVKNIKSTTSPYFGEFTNRNVVVIIWESFSREWVTSLNKDIKGYRGFTPFVDSLITKSYTFKNAYANGRKSIDAIPAVTAGIPALEKPFVLSNYSGNNITTLPAILKKKNYYSAFFHGAPNGSMGFSAFTKQAGFDQYFGMNEFNDKSLFDGYWGIFDDAFLQFTAKEISKLQQPFLSVVFTVSSHDPYVIPNHLKGKFPKGDTPIIESIGYTDYALKKFFETASKMPWYENTLFVITADHSIGGVLPEYKNSLNAFAIPIILYAPNSDFSGFDTTTVVQQADILPTTLSLLGEDIKIATFGNDMFDKNAFHYAANYLNGAFQWYEDDFALKYSNEKIIGLYNLKTDKLLNHNLVTRQEERANAMSNNLKAFMQQFNKRMIDNELTMPGN